MIKLLFDNACMVRNRAGAWLALHVKDPVAASRFVDQFHSAGCKLCDAQIKTHREKRSLDANAYFWTLLGQLAEVLGGHTTELYRELIREIGGNFQIVPIPNDKAEQWMKDWERGEKSGWFCESLGPSKLEGYTNIKCYRGSSSYDTKQMSRLIDAVVEECKIQGIQTETPEEIERLKQQWQNTV